MVRLKCYLFIELYHLLVMIEENRRGHGYILTWLSLYKKHLNFKHIFRRSSNDL